MNKYIDRAKLADIKVTLYARGELDEDNIVTLINLLDQIVSSDDCYFRALPGEPKFTVLARDPNFFEFVMNWSTQRLNDVKCGDRPDRDYEVAQQAERTAVSGQKWRRDNLYRWRK